MSSRGARFAIATLLLCCGPQLQGCSPPEADKPPIVIGYLGGISGRASSLGLAGRDGATLAVEEINAAGGIDGRRVFLEVADDGAGADASADGMRQLDAKGAIAIVGPLTSASAAAAVPIANRLDIPLVSPTVSSTDLSGNDDYFLRTCSDNQLYASVLASEAISTYGVRTAATISDAGNASYTFTLRDHFTDAFENQGGKVIHGGSFTSGENADYTALARAAVDSGADCVLVIANPIDTGMLSQRIRQAGYEGRILLAHWAASSDDLISTGGSGVEGSLFLDNYDRQSEEPTYRAMVSAFEERFSYEPTFASVHSYDAVMMIADAVRKDPDAPVKESLLALGQWQGIQSPIALDSTGDTVRPFYLMTVRDGQFTEATRP